MTSASDWSTRIIRCGGRLRSFLPFKVVSQEAAHRLGTRDEHAFLATCGPPREPPRGPLAGSATVSLARRILGRGASPPTSPQIERKLLELVDLPALQPQPHSDDLSPRLDPAGSPPSEWDVLEVIEWIDSRASAGQPSGVQPPRFAPLVLGPAHAARLTHALLEGIDNGWLAPADTWTIAVNDSLALASDLLPACFELLAVAESLCDERIVSRECWCLPGGARPFILRRDGVTSFEILPATQDRPRPDVEITLEPEKGPDDELPEASKIPHILVRSTDERDQTGVRSDEDTERASPSRSKKLTPALTWLLRSVFAKSDFRAGQLQAVTRLLDGSDCALRLPSGEGKSLVYQLAGLLRPGSTIVVEPTDLAIDTQVEMLRSAGFDNVERLSARQPGASAEPGPGLGEPAGSFFAFATAADLRRAAGRERLGGLTGRAPVALVVVDVAQCASEWSSQFRPSYVGLLSALRPLLGSNAGPTLALLDSPRREIVRDTLRLISDPATPGALVDGPISKPGDPSVEVVQTSPEEALPALQGLLKALPKQFGLPAARFYDAEHAVAPRGLLLCSRTDGPFGLLAVHEAVRATGLCRRIGLLSTETPFGVDQEAFARSSREDLDAFRAGSLSLMIASSDVCLDLDPAPLGYLVHFGIPPALEILQAQAGRLPRRSEQTRSFVVAINQSGKALGRLLSPRTSGSVVRAEVSRRKSLLGEPDDLMRSLASHTEWFAGAEAEQAEIENIADMLLCESGSESGSIALPFGDSRRARRRGLYRLTALGVIRDWIEDDDTARFLVTRGDGSRLLPEQEFWRCALDVAPTLVRRLYADSANVSELPSQQDLLVDRSRRILDLVYETVEPARREGVADLAGFVGSPGDRTLAISGPPPGGTLASDVEALVATRHHRIADWTGILNELMLQDVPAVVDAVAGLPHGPSADAGVELTRASLALYLGHSADQLQSHLARAFAKARRDYGEDWSTLQELFDWLMPRVRALAPRATANLWAAWEEAGGELEPRKQEEWPAHLLRASEIRTLADPSQSLSEAVVVLERRLREAQSILDALEKHYYMEEAEL